MRSDIETKSVAHKGYLTPLIQGTNKRKKAGYTAENTPTLKPVWKEIAGFFFVLPIINGNPMEPSGNSQVT